MSIIFKSLFALVFFSTLVWGDYTHSGEVFVATTDGKEEKIYEDSFALVIGLSEYDPANSWDKLIAVPKETALISDALRNRGFEVETTSSSLSGAELSQSIKSFLSRKVSRDTRLIVFFSGHGWSEPDQSMGYLVPTDAPRQDHPDFISTLTSMAEIKSFALLSNAKHILFVFDSCFSGSVFETRNSTTRKLSRLQIADIDQPLTYFITSGSAGEEVPAQSDFAYAFLSGLEGEADRFQDGFITAEELGMYLNAVITPNNRQTPQYGAVNDQRFARGQMIFPAANVPTPDYIVPAVPNTNTDNRSKGTSDVTRPLEKSLSDRFEGVDMLYFQRDLDQGVVDAVLDSSGISYRVTRSTEINVPSNVVTCAPGVDFTAVKMLATELVSNGVPLRGIAPTVYPKRVGQITIENYGRYMDQSLLTINDIERMQRCPDVTEMP